jgi:esterase
MKLFFREAGTGRVVVILHGLFGSSDNWQSFAKDLAAGGNRVITADLRNHGQSPHGNTFNYAAMSDDVAALIRDVTTEKVHLIGHSMGGKVAMQLSHAHPELLSGITIIDIAPRYYAPHHQSILAGLQSFNPATLASRSEAEHALAEYIKEPGVRQFLLKNLYWKQKEELGWRFNLPVIANNIEEVGKEITAAAPSSIPALFIGGEQSQYIKEEDKVEISAMYPNSQILTAPAAGHWVHADNPKWLLDVMLTRLGSG